MNKPAKNAAKTAAKADTSARRTNSNAGNATTSRTRSTAANPAAPWTGGVRVERSSGRKLGEQLAEQIEEEIIANGWPVGAVLGSEADLIERYGVSRAVFREGIRIVDHHGVAEMRRGPGGGLVVVEPNAEAAARTLSLNLEFLDLKSEQINEARLAIEIACVRSAVEHLDDNGRRRIREFIAGEMDTILAGRDSGRAGDDFPTNDFHLLIAELTNNPAMRLFVDILIRITSRHSGRAPSLAETAGQVHRAHSHIAKAILDGDADLAERRMRTHLNSVVEFLHR